MIVLNQNPPGDPGATGDSLGETGRELVLRHYLQPENNLSSRVRSVYEACHSKKGYVRHPETPWREPHMSSDNLKPFYICTDLWGTVDLRIEIEKHLSDNSWMTGNGTFINPGFFACIKRARGVPSNFWDFSFYGQAITMTKIPWRWSDSTKWFERSEGSSADYLNWFMSIIQAECKGHTPMSLKAKNSISPELLMRKVSDYYAPEKDAFVLDLYAQAVKKIWSVPS